MVLIVACPAIVYFLLFMENKLWCIRDKKTVFSSFFTTYPVW